MIATSLKALALFMRQTALTQIIEDVHMPVTRLITCLDIGVVNLIKKSVFYQNLDFRIFIFATSCVCVTGLLPIRQILNTRQLMIRGVFPFDETPYPIFEIIYTLQYYGLMIECAWCVIFDPAVMGLVRWITFQINVLQSNFQHCDDGIPRGYFVITDNNLERERERQSDNNIKILNKSFIPFTEKEANVTNDSFLLRFCHCVKNHRRLIEILNRFNDLFGLILFAQITSDCLLTCIGLFQFALTIKRRRKNLFRDLVMLGSGLIHLGYWSIYGNLLINEHHKLAKSVYNCGWENHISSPKIKPVIVFGFYQALTPMVMQAGYFFIFSMKTYLSVIQKAYSYFAILNTMIE
ncbi:uncharacterized protein LOC141533963 [Cotesia typhae]